MVTLQTPGFVMGKAGLRAKSSPLFTPIHLVFQIHSQTFTLTDPGSHWLLTQMQPRNNLLKLLVNTQGAIHNHCCQLVISRLSQNFLPK